MHAKSHNWQMEPLTPDNYKAAAPGEIYELMVEEHPALDLWYVIRKHPKNSELILVVPVEFVDWGEQPPVETADNVIAYDPDSPDVLVADLTKLVWLPLEDMIGAVFDRSAAYLEEPIEQRLLDSFIQ